MAAAGLPPSYPVPNFPPALHYPPPLTPLFNATIVSLSPPVSPPLPATPLPSPVYAPDVPQPGTSVADLLSFESHVVSAVLDPYRPDLHAWLANCPASKCFDAVTNTSVDEFCGSASTNLCHTAYVDQEHSLTYTLDAIYLVSAVAIFNKPSNHLRLRQYTVSVGNSITELQQCASGGATPSEDVYTHSCGLVGRVIRLSVDNEGTTPINLREFSATLVAIQSAAPPSPPPLLYSPPPPGDELGVDGATVVRNASHLRSLLQPVPLLHNSSAPTLVLFIPPGLVLRLSEELVIIKLNVRIFSVGEGAVLDAQRLSRVIYVGVGATLTLERVHLVNGYTVLSGGCLLSHTDRACTGVGCDWPRALILLDVSISDCQADDDGGGVSVNHDVRVQMTNVTIEASSAARLGGALFVYELSAVQGFCRGCVFRGCRSSEGGAINIADRSQFEFSGILERNEADGSGGAIAVHSGAALIVDRTAVRSSLSITDGGSIFVNTKSTLLVRDSFFNVSSAYAHGGWMASRDSTVQIVRSTIHQSSCARDGGLIHAEDSKLVLDDVSSSDSRAARHGGALSLLLGATLESTNLRVVRAHAAAHGGVFYLQTQAKAEAIHTLAVEPRAAEGVVAYMGGGAVLMATLLNATITCAPPDAHVALLVRDEPHTPPDALRGVSIAAAGCVVSTRHVAPPGCYASDGPTPNIYQNALQNFAEEPVCASQATVCVDTPLADGSATSAPACACRDGTFAASAYLSEEYSAYNPRTGCLVPLVAESLSRTSESIILPISKSASDAPSLEVNLTLTLRGTDLSRAAQYEWSVNTSSLPFWIIPLRAAGPVETSLPITQRLEMSVSLLVAADPAPLHCTFIPPPGELADSTDRAQATAGLALTLFFSARDVDGLPIVFALRTGWFSAAVTRNGAAAPVESSVSHVAADACALTLTPLQLGVHTITLLVEQQGEWVAARRARQVNISACVSELSPSAGGDCVCREGFERSPAGRCVPCRPGYFKGAAGDYPCELCAAGTYGAASGAVRCEPCGAGYFQPLAGQAVPCEQCESGKSSRPASAACTICAEGRYTRNASEQPPLCRACPSRATCAAGSSLESLLVERGAWRVSTRSEILYQCKAARGATPCQGSNAANRSLCTPGHSGLLCEVCTQPGHYFDSGQASCTLCPDAGNVVPAFLGVVLGVPLVVALLMLLVVRLLPTIGRIKLVNSLHRVFYLVFEEVSMIPTLKLLIATCQTAFGLPSIYSVDLPESYRDVFDSVQAVFQVDLTGLFMPTDCLPSGFKGSLLLTGTWPLVLLGFLVMAGVVRAVATYACSLKAVKMGTLNALPWVLFVSYCALPRTSTTIFSSWTCDQYVIDSTTVPPQVRHYLRKSVSTECYSPAHDQLVTIATVFILIYPVGTLLVYLLLLYRCRKLIRLGRSTRLVRATAFLHREYRKQFFFWEPIAVMLRLVLVGFLQLIPTEFAFIRLVFALIACVIYTILLAATSPFKRHEHNMLAILAHILLIFYLIGLICLKLFQEAEQYGISLGDADLAENLLGFTSEDAIVAAMLIATLLFAILFVPLCIIKTFQQGFGAILLLVETQQPPDLELTSQMSFHLFLSHAWVSAQDQVAVIKRQLQLMLRGAQIFLDVDDLEDTGKLEEYVARSQAVLVFLSKGYFFSHNCIRELECALELKKQLILVHEADTTKGGAPLAELRVECCSGCPKAVDAIFACEHPPIAWLRVAEFQRLTLKLIAELMLQASPAFKGRSYSPGGMLYFMGEVRLSELVLASPVKIYASRNNPGSATFMREFVGRLSTRTSRSSSALSNMLNVVHLQPTALMPPLRSSSMKSSSSRRFSDRISEAANRFRRASVQQAVRASLQLVRVRSPTVELDGFTHMLLYLNGEAFVGRQGMVLADELRQALRVGLNILLVHENDPSRDACPFDTFFTTTPLDLISNGLYKKIAIPMYAEPHRTVSQIKVLQELGGIVMKTRRLSYLKQKLKSRMSFVRTQPQFNETPEMRA
ncbi:hypothetical protein AB1Y20_007703 [Prymnesium parvum]|uniref:Phosphoinositide phospholipase C n=1 Tax=Prymnesium parvum TaxID=97485 RepID=A0AB34IVT0_PRYPA